MMINVLYVTYAYEHFDGATYSLANMIESVKNHVQPYVLCRGNGEVYNYFNERGIECIISDYAENIYTKPNGLWNILKFYSLYIYRMYKRKAKNNSCIEKVIEWSLNKNIQIVHTNTGVLTIGCEIAERLRAKHVWHLREFQDKDFGWSLYSGWKSLKKKIYSSDAVIGITKVLLEHYISADVSNAYVLNNAVRSKYDCCLLPKEKYFLFCACALCKTKGPDVAIKAFAHSQLYKKNYRLKLLGKKQEPFYSELQEIVKDYGISSYVDFLGNTDDVKKYMSKATAFLMCSQNEAMGRVTIEAMFYGTPVIGRNEGGTKEIISNGKTGYLFNSIEECSHLMVNVTRIDNIFMIENAQSYVKENFSIENYGQRLLSIYNKIVL